SGVKVSVVVLMLILISTLILNNYDLGVFYNFFISSFFVGVALILLFWVKPNVYGVYLNELYRKLKGKYMLKRLTSLILNLGRFLKRLMELPLYHASGIIPRNKNLWVVGAWRNEFVDNPKYFFISTSLNKDLNVKCVWLSRSSTTVKFIKEMGFESVKSSSLKGIYISLRAGIYFYNSSVNDISFIASKGAILVNLWHGIPL